MVSVEGVGEWGRVRACGVDGRDLGLGTRGLVEGGRGRGQLESPSELARSPPRLANDSLGYVTHLDSLSEHACLGETVVRGG